MAGGGVRRLAKSRYDSVSAYLHQRAHATKATSEYFNDVSCELDDTLYQMLIDKEIDPALSRHVAHLFVRDPLVAFEGNIKEVDDKESVEHFESINSTNWQTMRWKPPPVKGSGPHIGWRTEFRPMEVQITDFENAALVAFTVLITRVLLVFDLDFLVPLSKVDQNMERAHKIDAVNKCKFWFRTHVIPEDTKIHADNSVSEFGEETRRPTRTASDAVEEMTMKEIMSGKEPDFPGLIPLCYAYLEHIQCDSLSFARIKQYLTFIELRASGKLMTDAAWIRKFVREHPEYKKDSVVSAGIAYDLVQACDKIGRGQRACREILGEVAIESITKESAYGTPLRSALSGKGALPDLLSKIKARASNADGPQTAPTAPLRVWRRYVSM
jgi:glutamate--cysteine ligase catalytic subunit